MIKKIPLVVDKDPYKGLFVCGICAGTVQLVPKTQSGNITWRITCPRCGTLMACCGTREELLEKATKKFYIKPLDKPTDNGYKIINEVPKANKVYGTQSTG